MAVPIPWPTYSRTTENPAAVTTPSHAAPMSESRCPTRTASIAASREALVTSISRREFVVDVADRHRQGAASACQPSMMAPQSMETMSPSSSSRGPGMPCTITSFGEMQATAGNPW